jgi:hypothetical protein
MSVESQIALLTLPNKTRRFAILFVASEGDVRYAAQRAEVLNSDELLQSPQVQQYIELLQLLKIERLTEAEVGLKEALATREDAGRFLSNLINDPEATTREKLSAVKMYLVDFKPASAEKKSLISIREVGRQAEEEVG